MATARIIPVDATRPLPVQSAELWATVHEGDKSPKVGTTRIIYGKGTRDALSSLGEKFSSQSTDAQKESVRRSVGAAVKALKDAGDLSEIVVDTSAVDARAAAAAAHLAQYKFTLKTAPSSAIPEIKPDVQSQAWDEGVIGGRAQNLARTLMELPANMMTPTLFAERVKSEFSGLSNVEVVVRDEAWAKSKGMNLFLSVTHGTAEPAKIVEIHYRGSTADASPLALVGKGITFDSGGISLKPGADMKLMRGDMGGAATVVATALAVAQLRLPVNLTTVVPLTENMPGPSATKPGDVFYGMNGKSVEVDNTDAEGRLVLADAIYYAATAFKPHTLVDVATLTGAMDVSLGEVFSGVFTNSETLWNALHAAGEAEYDRFWRMPLDEDYGPQIHSCNADLQNSGGRPAGSCTAALFLQAFAEGGDIDPAMQWAHVDIAGTMEATRPTLYLEKGMTGRPVRALVEFIRRRSA
ncbi:hypothetical protein FISHEDRAFT_40118 [Fistulina hepatica ATCC 64428]|uniref:leucyl aminopeptidase n=1 Tax=Fistulina hepatica ATCC 64428 TaxID=1128425 RepID=A0A0D7AFV6_9AGAR|nr:hypothetical protein FISHEDRAFT_40118 [Fistulina hepatica ATCC 64428]